MFVAYPASLTSYVEQVSVEVESDPSVVSLSPLSVLPDSLLVSLVVSLVSVEPVSVLSPELESVDPLSSVLLEELLVRVEHSVIELHESG